MLKRPCWHIPNWTITCSTAITTARYGTSWQQTSAQQRQAIARLAEHYGIMFFFYRGQEPIDGQLAQVINGFRDTYGLSVIPVSVDGVINPLLPDSRTDQGQAQRLGVKYFPAMMLVDPKQGSVRPLSYGFISQDDLAKQFLNVSEDFKPNF
ncbi:conjugal transfer protein TraF [Klebsiella pneumoniae]|nr:conjugal transfer protein TraF [Klebsiella pneumoniae]